MFLLVSFFTSLTAVIAPPVAPICLVRQNIHKLDDVPTPCDYSQPLRKLLDLVNDAVPRDQSNLGAKNMADLILSRCCQIFDYQQHSLENIHICEAHLKELGSNWKENVIRRSAMMRKRERLHKCMISVLSGFEAHESSVEARAWLTKCESELIVKRDHKFYPLGTRKFICYAYFISICNARIIL